MQWMVISTAAPSSRLSLLLRDLGELVQGYSAALRCVRLPVYPLSFRLHSLAGSSRSLRVHFPCDPSSRFNSSCHGKYTFQRQQHLILKLRKHAEVRDSVPDESRWLSAKISTCTDPPRLDCNFQLLHPDDKWWLVRSFVMRVLHVEDERSIARAPQAGFCCPESFEKGFTAAAHFLDVATAKSNRTWQSC